LDIGNSCYEASVESINGSIIISFKTFICYRQSKVTPLLQPWQARRTIVADPQTEGAGVGKSRVFDWNSEAAWRLILS
jgi:hypothetical protein